MKLEAVLNIKAIIRFEQISGKSFFDIDFENIEDLNNLLYSATVCSNQRPVTKDEFMIIISNETTFNELATRVKKHNEIVSQFSNRENKSCKSHEESSELIFVSNIVANLIIEGVDPEFIYNMWLCDLPLLINAYDQKKKEQMESSRLWTYLTILPHIESKKIKSPVDLFPFPWEIEEITLERKKTFDNALEKYDKFINGLVKFK